MLTCLSSRFPVAVSAVSGAIELSTVRVWLAAPCICSHSCACIVQMATRRASGPRWRAQSLRRDEYFVTSKIPGGLNASATTSALEQSLAQLKLPYVDLMLLHWPGSGAKSRQEQWVALESWAKQGKARAIGISHYCRHHLDDILKVATLPVALNQVQYHVGMVRRTPASGSRTNLPACACTTR